MNKEWTDKLVKAFMVLCGLMTVGIVPVSYTHLDVYKRQVMIQVN